jgi:alpha-beta hydrolase superfamily lysophospholipase
VQQRKPVTPKAEFLTYQTEDRVQLEALLFTPDAPTRDALILIPGMTGGFIATAHDFLPLAQRANDAGMAMLLPNMRTAGLHGMLFVRFADYVADIAAAVAALKARGCERLFLFGTSLGGPRSILYWTRTREPAIRALGFLCSIKSPYLEAQIRFDAAERGRLDAFLQRCRDLLRAGRGKEVLSYANWFPGRDITMAAASFIDVFGTLEESDASTIKFGAQVTIPAAVIHGSKDDLALPPNANAIYDSLTAAPKRELIWVEGGNHFLAPGKFANAYADAVVGWLRKEFAAR